jgi:hypothetical protein
LGAAFAVVVVSFLALFVPIIIYAFVLAFRARGVPDQAAINHFAATISPSLMPWLERLLTLALAFWVVRRTEAASVVDGLLVGVLSGLLSVAVMLSFGAHLTTRSLLAFLILAGLGWVGGFVGQRMSATAPLSPGARR